MKNILKSYNIFTIVFALAIILTVICTPVFGLGDLSEYMSTFESVGLYNTHADTYAISQNYGIAEPGNSAKSGFEVFLLGIISLNKLLFSKTVFNIHFISVVYSVVFLLSMYFLQKNMHFEKNYLNYVFSALLGIVFLDLGYLAYFNSFYNDALIFVLIIGMAATAVSASRKFSCAKLVIFAAMACALSLMRFSAAVIALIAAVVMAVVAFTLKDNRKYAALIMSVLVAAVSVVSMMNAYVPARDVKLYNHIYNDMAVDSDTALAELGLADKVIPENPTAEDMKAAVDGVNYSDIVKYYAKHPSQFGANMKSAANNAYFLIQDYATYGESGAYYGVRDITAIKVWNFLKRTILPNGIWVILCFIAVYAVIAIREFIKNKKENNMSKAYLAIFAAILPAGALAEMVGTVLTTGKILISKNMFVFGVYFDLMLVTTVVWAVATLMSRQETIKSKYGVRQ